MSFLKSTIPIHFSVYRLTLEARERIELTRLNKGITLRGAFGSTFRRLVCHDLKAPCRECPLHADCPYGHVFAPTVPEASQRLRLNRDIPRPFVIKPPLNDKTLYEPGEDLVFDLVVVGSAQAFLPYFIVTFEELGRRGVGVKRGQYKMKKLEAMKSDRSWGEVYDYRDRMVRPPGESLSIPALLNAERVGRVDMAFLTPMLLKEKGQWVKPAFGPLAKRLRDRVQALSYFYCGKALDMDFKAYGNQSEGIQTVEEALRWKEEARYARHRNVRHLLKGYVGTVAFEGDLTPFMPFLRAGEFLHAGKATAFGQGWYDISATGGDASGP